MGANAVRSWSVLQQEKTELTLLDDAKGSEIRLNGVSKSFADQPVIHELNLTVQQGQFIAVVGRSGCGKSTLLRLLAGLESPSQGSITIDGEAVNGLLTGTTVMFQDSRLIPWKSVIANVGLGLKGDWKPRAEEALRQVGLENRRDDWPGMLSGGQKQRVALARALVRKPKLLLLDEPLSALDALTKLEMQQLIASLWGEQRFTTLLVTHDVSEAVRLADRILLIDQGRVALDVMNTMGRPRQVTDVAFGELEKQVLERIFKEQSI
jgi:sulfonate transport system ATP-binding protein